MTTPELTINDSLSSWLFTKYVRAPVVRIRKDRFVKKPSRSPELTALCPAPRPPHFRLLDLPVELQISIFDHVVEPWSLSISTHEDSCLGDFLCSIDYGFVSPGPCKRTVLKCSKQIRSMLNLLLIHPALKPIMLNVIDKRYTCHASWSSCGVYCDAGKTLWQVPKAIRQLVMSRTPRIAILGIVPPCAVRRLFPKSRIMYHDPTTPLKSMLKPNVARSILNGNLDDVIETLSDGLLVSRWRKWSPCYCCDVHTAYTVQFHTNILLTPDREVLVRLLPTLTGLAVASKCAAVKSTILEFWTDESIFEAVQSVATRSDARDRCTWITRLLHG